MKNSQCKGSGDADIACPDLCSRGVIRGLEINKRTKNLSFVLPLSLSQGTHTSLGRLDHLFSGRQKIG